MQKQIKKKMKKKTANLFQTHEHILPVRFILYFMDYKKTKETRIPKRIMKMFFIFIEQ